MIQQLMQCRRQKKLPSNLRSPLDHHEVVAVAKLAVKRVIVDAAKMATNAAIRVDASH